MRVAINGFGRIGRTVFRILNDKKNINVVAINDIADNDAMVYLLKYDTVMGPFKDFVNLNKDIMKTSYNSVKMLAIKTPEDLPWKELEVDVVGNNYRKYFIINRISRESTLFQILLHNSFF